MVGLKEIQWHVVCSTKIILVTVENGLYRGKGNGHCSGPRKKGWWPSLVTVRD